MVIELREFNDKKEKKNNMEKMQICYNLAKKWKCNEIFGIQIIFDVFCGVKLIH